VGVTLTGENARNAGPDWVFASQRFALFHLPSRPLAVWTRYGRVSRARRGGRCRKRRPYTNQRQPDQGEDHSLGYVNPVQGVFGQVVDPSALVPHIP